MDSLIEYHKKLLGLPDPWKVSDVKLDAAKQEVTIRVDYPAETLAYCPECNQLRAVHDHRERRWQHLSQMTFRTYLVCRIPRIDCEHHGILQVLVPWGEPNGRFTLALEAFAIAIMQGVRSLTDAANLLGMSWDSIQGIQKRAVLRGKELERAESLERLGIDEKSFLSRHRYATILCDLDKGRVLEVTQERTEESAVSALNSLTPEQRSGVKAIAMDFLLAYSNAAEKSLPNAVRVHDRFHVMGYLTKAVDKVRKGEHRQLLSEGSDILKKTKYLWLTNEVNWTAEQKAQYLVLRRHGLKVGRAFAMKEQFRSFWKAYSKREAREFFAWWYNWATHSRLKPMIEVSKSLKRHYDGLMNYFRQRITNAVSEGLNSKIQLIKSGARGFRNFDNYRVAILFHCGKLNLCPHGSP